MFFHTARLQFESKPDKPDPVYACTSCRSSSSSMTHMSRLGHSSESVVLGFIYSTGARGYRGPLPGRDQDCLAGWLRCSSAAMVWLSSFQLFSNLARPSRSSCLVTSSKSTPTVAN